MERYKKLCSKPMMLALSILFMWSSHAFAGQVLEEEGAELVARISAIEGRLERFDSESQAWVVTVQDTPVGVGDQVFADAGSRVEILIPNNTTLRIGEETEVRFVELTGQSTGIDLFSGTARLRNDSSRTEFVATTQFGRIEVPPETSADLIVNDKAVEIIPIEGSVYFAGNRSADRHEIIAGSASLLAFGDRVMPGNGSADRNWNTWNSGRDRLWAERRGIPGESRDYLPASLYDEAYFLNTSGSWHRVYYEGDYYRFWRPRYVDMGWSPFSVGMWMTWRGDRVWIPQEPFGWVTHHYGNWIYASGAWYWAPPVSRVTAGYGRSLLNIGFSWYPGRVAWIDADIHARWIPLGPFEPFYSRYPWGYRTIVIASGPYPRYIASHKFKYRRYTVTGQQDHFWRKRRGSHISKWRSPRRSGVHESPTPRNREREEMSYFRAERENSNDHRIRSERKVTEDAVRNRRKFTETGNARNEAGEVAAQRHTGLTDQSRSKQTADTVQRTQIQNRSGVNRVNESAVRTAPSDRAGVQNGGGAEVNRRDGSRRSTAETNGNTVSAVPEVNRRSGSQPPVERNSGSSDNRNRLQSSSETARRSGIQSRSGSTRTGGGSAARRETGTYHPR